MQQYRFNVDFYRIEDDENNTFEGAISEIALYKNEQDKNREMQDKNVIRLHYAKPLSTMHTEMCMTKIRMNDIPPKADKQGKVSPMHFREDEGIGEQTAMIYYRPYNVLAFQRNRYSVSPLAFKSYLYTVPQTVKFCGEILPILEPAIIQKMRDMVEIRSADIRVASVMKPDVFSNTKNYFVRAVNTLMDDFKAPVVALTISSKPRSKRGSSSILISKVKDAVNDFVMRSREPNSGVEKLMVRGVNSDGEMSDIDLLKEQMSEQIVIDSSKGRHIMPDIRTKCLLDALGKRDSDIKTLYRSKQ